MLNFVSSFEHTEISAFILFSGISWISLEEKLSNLEDENHVLRQKAINATPKSIRAGFAKPFLDVRAICFVVHMLIACLTLFMFVFLFAFICLNILFCLCNGFTSMMTDFYIGNNVHG